VLQPIYDTLGPERAEALPGLHCATGCDTTGSISSIGEKKAMKAFMKAPSHVIQALSELGINDQPSTHVIKNCEQFYCTLLSSKQMSSCDAATLRWKRI
jgi:5'-3' exonuclease